MTEKKTPKGLGSEATWLLWKQGQRVETRAGRQGAVCGVYVHWVWVQLDGFLIPATYAGDLLTAVEEASEARVSEQENL